MNHKREDKNPLLTPKGVELTDELIESLAAEAERGYDIEQLRSQPNRKNDVRVERRRYSLDWKCDELGVWRAGQAGEWIIRQDDWHDTGRKLPRWVLIYRGTRVHESDFMGRDPIDDCKRAADRHRGVSKA